MNITVCGAGPAGLGMAACLMHAGHRVTLYDMPDYSERIEVFRQDPAISATGKLTFSGRLDGATCDPAEALANAEAVFIVTHAAAHKKLAKYFAGTLRSEQIIVMCPGYVGGGLEFTQSLAKYSASEIPAFIEASSLPIISQWTDPHTVNISGWKRNFIVYRPEKLADHPILSWFQDLYAPLKFTTSPVEPGLNEINFIVHAVVSLLNAGRLQPNTNWTFYRDGLTPEIVRVIEAIDQERVDLESRLGLVPHPLTDLLTEFYANQGMSSEGLFRQLTTFEPFANVAGPCNMDSRFISEDLCYGLVPMAHLGLQHGLPMKTTLLIIQLATALTGTDYLTAGRTVEYHGA